MTDKDRYDIAKDSQYAQQSPTLRAKTREAFARAKTKFDAIDRNKAKNILQCAFVTLFIIAAFAISFALQVSKKPLRPKEITERSMNVQAMHVSPQTHTLRFHTTGRVTARSNIAITPQVSGRVIAINDNIFTGGTFEDGELLFQVDPTDYQLNLKRLEAQLAQALTAYNLEEAESAVAKAEWRQIHGRKKKAPDLVARKPQMDEARANLQAAEAQLDTAHLDLERTVFSLPFKGRILNSDLSIGQYVTQGQSYGSAYDMQDLEVQASIDETKLAWLLETPNPDITITTHYKGVERTFQGQLKRTAAQLNNQTRLAQIAVSFAPSDLSARMISESLLPGVFAELNITGPKIDNLVAVPTSAIQKGGHIWLINPRTQTLHARKADIAYDNGAIAYLRGFTKDRIIVSNTLSGAVEGAKVQYAPIEKPQRANILTSTETDKPSAQNDEKAMKVGQL